MKDFLKLFSVQFVGFMVFSCFTFIPLSCRTNALEKRIEYVNDYIHKEGTEGCGFTKLSEKVLAGIPLNFLRIDDDKEVKNLWVYTCANFKETERKDAVK